MGAMVTQITSVSIVYSTVCSGVDQRKHQSSASLAFVRGIHRRRGNSPHKWSVTQNMFPFDDAIMRRQWYWCFNSRISWPQPQGWGLLSQFPPFRYFTNFLALSKQTLAIEYHVYIWQVSPQLTCGDTCQIWMWFKESNMYFCHIENFAYGEINEWSFSNPHPSIPQLQNFVDW